MSDDPKKVGRPDRDRVSANEPYEVGGVLPVEPDHLGVGGRSPVLPG